MKRLIDIICSFIGVLLLSPFLSVIFVLLRIKIGAPVFFIQERPGINNKPFKMIKFRTMRNSLDVHGQLLPDKDRVILLGSILRKTSLDEFPELLNVLKGDMSLVGPRPLLMSYLKRYSKKQIRRHEVRPGITGWAQVNGRNAISWEEKFEFDVWYVDNHSIILDLKILFLTFWRVVRKTDINQDGHATMPVFMGSEEKENI